MLFKCLIITKINLHFQNNGEISSVNFDITYFYNNLILIYSLRILQKEIYFMQY